MAYSVWIEGTDRTALLRAGSLRCTFRSNYDNSCTFALDTTAAGYLPDVGQDVVVKNGSTTIWGGVIKTLTLDKLEPGTGTGKRVEVTVSSDGYRSIPSRRTVNYTYDQKSAGYIVGQIATVLSGEGVAAGTINAGADPVGEGGEYDAICKSCAEILDDIASASGYMWYIDEDKHLHFFDNNIVLTAAHHLVEGAAFVDFDIEEYEIGLDPYANKVFVRGGIGDDGLVVQAVVEDTTEQTARAASEGGTGVYGAVINDTNISTTSDATAAATTALKRNGVIPRTLVFTTGALDYWPGTKMTVNLPTLGLSSNTYFLIEEVELFDLDGINLRSRIRATSRKDSDFISQANQTGIEYLSKALSGAGASASGNNGPRIWVQDDTPTNAKDKDVWIDSNDYSRYDIKSVSASATVTAADGEYIELTGTTSGQTLTITSPGATGGACVKHIKNSSTQTWTIAATIDGTASPTLSPGAGIIIIWNNTDWRKVASHTPGYTGNPSWSDGTNTHTLTIVNGVVTGYTTA